ncbi:hypothetical protein TPHA_0P01830 [Tetrapisispora phaffii CBS 4417]|uniref:Enoyl reductase (ER) domain-containing protein n=1 Tax=Tetrapisispora phaffii (strain ATCC 24235 / CBS 4417 / NBRC 1672 / NRRL Y-8282 / UCD 70-5) TaxID=1071381 RepID=G8C2G2_TETPH|nr:hypothetical protein TPHA_0P01830 [Tetrapisispora phaffii CBS 4417]CCE66340.1 hypothetical protein TPHA_0P01830 [Tetrapisispora phaffii CBS 4417]
MNAQLPKQMKAVVIGNGKAVVKKDCPIPEIEDDFMLIKVIAVAGNPSEWKHIDMKLGPEGSILGCDAVGKVLKLGSKVDTNQFHVGDIVLSFVHGASNQRPKNGAFGEYIAVDQATTYKAPANIKHTDLKNLYYGPCNTFEGAVALPVSLTTAGIVIHHDMGLKLAWEPKEPQHDFPILIWGGATGVGQILVQLAKKIHGYSKIVVVASKKHEEMLKSFGADEVYDYHDENIAQVIKSKYPNIQHAIDTVSTEQTFSTTYKCVDDVNPVSLMQLLFLSENDIPVEDRKPNVKVLSTMIYKVCGMDIRMADFKFPKDVTYRKDTFEFVKFIRPYVQNGEIKHMPVKVFDNGLEDIPEITNMIRDGKAAGVKFVTVL